MKDINKFTVTTDDVLSISQAAKALNITRMTIYRWLHAGKIIAIKLGSERYILKTEIERIVADRRAEDKDTRAK